MKNRFLILLRHGYVGDNEGLATRGHEEVAWTAQTLRQNGFIPDFLVTSNRVRTIESSDILLEIMREIQNGMYFDLMGTVQQPVDFDACFASVPQESSCVVLSGHAETINHFSQTYLSDTDTAKLLSIVPESRVIDYLQKDEPHRNLFPQCGDALIMKHDKESNQFVLHAWISSRQSIVYAETFNGCLIKGQKLVEAGSVRLRFKFAF